MHMIDSVSICLIESMWDSNLNIEKKVVFFFFQHPFLAAQKREILLLSGKKLHNVMA